MLAQSNANKRQKWLSSLIGHTPIPIIIHPTESNYLYTLINLHPNWCSITGYKLSIMTKNWSAEPVLQPKWCLFPIINYSVTFVCFSQPYDATILLSLVHHISFQLLCMKIWLKIIYMNICIQYNSVLDSSTHIFLHNHTKQASGGKHHIIYIIKVWVLERFCCPAAIHTDNDFLAVTNLLTIDFTEEIILLWHKIKH